MENTINSRVKPVILEAEMKKSYIDYSMSVIAGRALPDVRDGLKPVHRRILYSMNESGVTGDKPYRKSARIVGDVMGRYHPHGDSSVYDALVRLAQDFSTRYMLADGQGNFGSVDGDSAAASYLHADGAFQRDSDLQRRNAAVHRDSDPDGQRTGDCPDPDKRQTVYHHVFPLPGDWAGASGPDSHADHYHDGRMHRHGRIREEDGLRNLC